MIGDDEYIPSKNFKYYNRIDNILEYCSMVANDKNVIIWLITLKILWYDGL